jgi:Tol biopolymer transport system component
MERLRPAGGGVAGELLFAATNDNSKFHLYRINVSSHESADLGEVSGNHDFVWAEPGKTVLFRRTVNGLTNIWSYNLQDRSLIQITFGTGSDLSPMPEPGGKGIYYVNGKSSGFLTVYDVHSKESTDIVSEDATQPAISPDGERVMYMTLPAPNRNELWVSDIDGGDDPEELVRRIADFRAAEKHDPEYYARHTVMKALAQLGKLTPPTTAATPDQENKQEREH